MLQAATVVDISTAVVTAASQTYSGSAKTPDVTVTLNGDTIPSSGYDVTYSNNVNAGTANITVTGKGNYTGTATGTFTINKAAPLYTAPAARSLTYSGSGQYLTTTGSTDDGQIYYSSDGTNWYTTRRTGTNAATYTTFWKLEGDSNHTNISSTSISTTISQKSLTITANAQTINYGSSIATGTSQVTTSGLVSGDSLTAITLTASTSNVTTTGKITPSAASISKGISNYSISYVKGNLTINAVAPSVTAPTAKSLTYNTSAQALVNAGSASGGTMYYKMTTTNSQPSSTSGFSTSIPTGTNAGTYYVWYYVKGDSNHTDTAINSTAISVSIAKASRSLSFPYLISVMVPGSSVSNPAVPSAGEGDGTITYSSGTTSKATVNSSTGEVTGVTSGTSVITASMSAGTNYAAASATYTMTVTTEINNFAYTGSVQSASLPASIYQLQVWGAQGGSNAAYSTYGITAQAGGKGGYSTGIVKIPSARTVYAFVGGQGSSSGNGGWNGGGGGTGTSNAGSESTATYGLGYSKCGGGGGATDIALTTSSMSYSSYRNNRASASLLSRMIVAGGGSGGAMSYNKVGTSRSVSMTASKSNKYISSTGSVVNDDYYMITAPISMAAGETLTGNIVAGAGICVLATTNSSGSSYTPITTVNSYNKHSISYTASSACYVAICYLQSGTTNDNKYKLCIESLLTSRNDYTTSTIQSPEWTKVFVDKDDKIIAGFKADGSYNEYITYTNHGSSTATIGSATTSTTSQVGYVGGGENGGGYSSTYQGRQTAYGTNGAFGLGANQGGNVTSYRYCAGAGGGGWYGGGSSYSNTAKNGTKYSGGGSGFVNISANSASRPSGYTGLELDQGTTYAGNTTFESTSGSTETGHSGNGYARIKWLSPLDAISDIVYDKLDPSNVDYSSITNPEWKHVLVDNEDKILAGIKKDGTIFISEYIHNL